MMSTTGLLFFSFFFWLYVEGGLGSAPMAWGYEARKFDEDGDPKPSRSGGICVRKPIDRASAFPFSKETPHSPPLSPPLFNRRALKD